MHPSSLFPHGCALRTWPSLTYAGVRGVVARHQCGVVTQLVAGVQLHDLLSSAREFHWSYTYTRAFGDSSSCTCWHSIVYDLYLFVLDLCISW